MNKRLFPLKKKAFTLVELLVVVAVIGILIGIVVPAVNRGIAAADTARCAANMRTVGMALTAYAQDHKGKLPLVYNQVPNYEWIPGFDGWSEAAKNQRLAYVLEPYGTEPACFECPAALRKIGRPAAGAHYRVPYRIEHEFLNRAYPFGNISLGKEPMNLFQLQDQVKLDAPKLVIYYESVVPGNPNYMQEPAHRGKQNWLFLDGHVETLAREELDALNQI